MRLVMDVSTISPGLDVALLRSLRALFFLVHYCISLSSSGCKQIQLHTSRVHARIAG